MSKITPHLWYDREAVEAAELYTASIPDSKITNVNTLRGTPSGDTDIVSFDLAGQSFMSISAGPLFKFTPAVSFLVACRDDDEVDRLWDALGRDGEVMMPLESYPFSPRYGWTADRYGLSWQVMHHGDREIGQRITPTLMFVGDVCGKAEEAIGFYTSLFPNSKVEGITRWEAGDSDNKEGTVQHAGFSLDGFEMAAMDSGYPHDFGFNESISFMVYCADQDELDYYWNGLSADPAAEQCGWLKDKYGLSWQVVPTVMDEMMATGTPEQMGRVTEAFLQMKKFDIAELQRAYES